MKTGSTRLYTEYGDFSKDGLEFVVRRPDTPRPWINFLSNGEYCLQLSQTGAGFSFYLDAEQNHLTRWEPAGYLKNEPGRFVYIRDSKNGKFWSATQSTGKYSCRHGLGYTVISAEEDSIQTEITYFVPEGVPTELWLVRVRNNGSAARDLKVFPFVEWQPGHYFADLSIRNIHILMNRGTYDEKSQAAFIWRYPWGNKPWRYEAFAAMSLPVESHDTDYEEFFGRYGNYAAPRAVREGKCSGSGSTMGVNMVGALQGSLSLRPGEQKEFVVSVGVSKSRAENLKVIKKCRDLSFAKEALERTVKKWRSTITDNVWVKTPDREFDLAVNVWLKYQTVMNNHWGRSHTFFHEGGGEFGYRNTSQDAWAMVSIDVKYALKRMIKLAEHQRKNGQPLPGWSLQGGPTSHKPPSDFPIWLPMLLLQYVRETGDVRILKKKVKFYDGGSATLYEHAKRATMFLQHISKSKRGLPLMGTQDWNDAFDMTGVRGRGESVWLGMGLCVALKNMQELASYVSDKAEIARAEKDYLKMKGIINKYAWDGGWYVYAFNDFGEPIGSRKNKESRIQLNSQTWAIMADLPDCAQLEKMLKVVDNDLDTPYGPVLFTPCYTKYSDRIGRITAFAPGTKENAAIFSHGGAFKVVSDLHIGRAEEAYKTFKQLLPMSSNKDIEVYRTEPYVLAEYLIGPGNPRYGEGAFTWLTGSSDWLLVAGTQYMLGFKPQLDGVLFDPCIPSEWKECRIRRIFRGASYDIIIRNPQGVNKGVKYLVVNGKKQESPVVSAKGTAPVFVEVVMGE